MVPSIVSSIQGIEYGQLIQLIFPSFWVNKKGAKAPLIVKQKKNPFGFNISFSIIHQSLLAFSGKLSIPSL